MMRKRLLLIFVLAFLTMPLMAQAQQLQVISQPDRVHVFQNNVAFVHDTLSLPGGADVQLVLPVSALVDTLVLRENGERVNNYSIRRDTQIVIAWQSESSDTLREITAEYLMEGMGWRPKYDMVIHDETASAEFDFFAEIQNNTFALDDVEMYLVAGGVGTSQIFNDGNRMAMNQLYAADETDNFGGNATSLDSVTIQHVYELGNISVPANETLYTQIVSKELPVRRVLLWNANVDTQVTVIYKVKNDSDQPFSPGVVRSYRDGLILGSDAIERTPIGSEGSVTVGSLPDVRVQRGETTEQVNPNEYYDTLHQIAFEIYNFSADTVTIEVIDFFPEASSSFEFRVQPERESGNVLRWEFTLEPGESIETSYSYLTP